MTEDDVDLTKTSTPAADVPALCNPLTVLAISSFDGKLPSGKGLALHQKADDVAATTLELLSQVSETGGPEHLGAH